MTKEAGEQELLEAKRRLEGIVASAMDAIITIDERQRIVLFNPAAEQMFGTPTIDALRQPISRFIPERFRAAHDEHIQRFRNVGITGRRMGALGAISGLRANGEEFPIEASISQVDIGGERLATVILRDITERLANEEARLLLAREVDHRAKNALAVVQALVSLTTAATKEEFVAAVRGRVGALGRAHSLLARNRWAGGDIKNIITDETLAYQRPGQVNCRGPAIVLSPNAVQPVSLLVHELAANAVKYGALSAPEGHVDISWRVASDKSMAIQWIESGGPAVAEPQSHGFGSTLINTVARQLGGQVDIEWLPTGIWVIIEIPASCFRVGQGRGPSPEKSSAFAATRAPLQKAGRLLLVEDELLIAIELANALKSEGWDVIGPAGTVEEALQLLDEGGLPDAAVLDINLNGQLVYPVADFLLTRGVPCLFSTGYETANDNDDYKTVPVVHKPTDLRLLIETLHNMVSDAGSNPELRDLGQKAS